MSRRIWLITAALIACMSACLGTIKDDTVDPTPMGGNTSVGGGGGDDDGHCVAPADGLCDQEEDCECDACAEAAAGCNDGYGCIADGLCLLGIEDACLCSDCDHDVDCVANCLLDGMCDVQSEGCGCPDCSADPLCEDNAGYCDGGAPDGTCGMNESCECNDCINTEKCACQPDIDGYCDFNEPCTCADCANSVYCAFECNNDGICSGAYEGCGCADCQDEPLCASSILDCDNGVIDNTCDLGNDGCLCPDCIGTEACMCVPGICDVNESPCFCGGCDTAAFCITCVDDGVCDHLEEGCACPDCFGESGCGDNTQACDNGTPDGTCGGAEGCGCSDCMDTLACMCNPLDDGLCDVGVEGCFCADCAGTLNCQDCFTNDICTPAFEPCSCVDCGGLKACL
jgi:hypothetical protein